jgi:predicted Fe-Mo cluster-binding NifX family protein
MRLLAQKSLHGTVTTEGEAMKVAIAIWRDRIAPVFDVSKNLLVLEIENNWVAKQSVEVFEKDNPAFRISKLMDLKIETLICGAISNPLSQMISLQGIKTIPFTCGQITPVIQAFLHNKLPDHEFMMPGCCGYRKRARTHTHNSLLPVKEGVKTMSKGNKSGSGGGKTMSGQGRCGGQGRQSKTKKGCGGSFGQGRGSGQGRKKNRQPPT